MKIRWIELEETDSTNRWLHEDIPPADEEMAVVTTDYQTAGRGCGTNRWVSDRGQNLLLSIRVSPSSIQASRQFLLSMAGGLSLKAVLDRYTKGITLKWPNDVYWNDSKLSGTLIETSLSRGQVRRCIFGIGLNVNQLVFPDDIPNPVSLRQILGREVDRQQLLIDLVGSFKRWISRLERHPEEIQDLYEESLYRREGYHLFKDADGRFEARIVKVHGDGRLQLEDRQGRLLTYAFKEVEFIIK